MYLMISSDNEQGDHNRLFSLCWKGGLCTFLELKLIQLRFLFLILCCLSYYILLLLFQQLCIPGFLKFVKGGNITFECDLGCAENEILQIKPTIIQNMVNQFMCLSKLTTACVAISLVKNVGDIKYVYHYMRKFRRCSTQSQRKYIFISATG